ncbi:MAG TPA: cupredoxin domain-containing protein [Anaerolineales bacterium]|nr:cupredoxin domain-containing protein [Anaerolineales bacterium]
MKNSFIYMAVLFSLLLVSCGGASGPSTTIDVTMTDFQFQPSQFTVPAGQEISFSSSNNGAVVHNFVIMKLDTTAGPMFDEEDIPNVYWEVELVPGATTETSFTAPTEPGEYQVVCRTEGHIASGMTSKLIVVPAEE